MTHGADEGALETEGALPAMPAAPRHCQSLPDPCSTQRGAATNAQRGSGRLGRGQLSAGSEQWGSYAPRLLCEDAGASSGMCSTEASSPGIKPAGRQTQRAAAAA